VVWSDLSLTSCQLILIKITAGVSRVASGLLCLRALANDEITYTIADEVQNAKKAVEVLREDLRDPDFVPSLFRVWN